MSIDTRKAEKTVRMTEGRPLSMILTLAVPMILSNLFQQLYNVIDTLIVGNSLGTQALAAVGNAGSITAVSVQLATGLALGGSIVISQYFGAGRTEKIWPCTTTLTIFTGGVAFVSAVVIWCCCGPLLALVKTPPEIMQMSMGYLRFYFLGSIPIFVYNALSGVYVALGDSRTPLVFLVISSVANVVLDLVFIVALRWGVRGAAAATALSQFLAAGLALLDVPRLLAGFGSGEMKPVFDRGLLATMLRFALPSALQQSVVSVGSVVVQAIVNSFGPAVIAGSAAASKIISMATVVPINYSNAYANYVGQNVGAGKLERVWPGLRSSLLCCGAACLGITAFVEFFPGEAICMFVPVDDPNFGEVLEVGTAYIRVVGAFLVVFSAFMLLKATFKGSGDMLWFILTTMLSFLIRLAMTVGMAHTVGVGVIWWSFCAGWLVSLAVSIARYVQGGWKEKGLVE